MPEDSQIVGVESVADDLGRAEPFATDAAGVVQQGFRRAVRQELGFGAVAAVSLAGVTGWLGYEVY